MSYVFEHDKCICHPFTKRQKFRPDQIESIYRQEIKSC